MLLLTENNTQCRTDPVCNFHLHLWHWFQGLFTKTFTGLSHTPFKDYHFNFLKTQNKLNYSVFFISKANKLKMESICPTHNTDQSYVKLPRWVLPAMPFISEIILVFCSCLPCTETPKSCAEALGKNSTVQTQVFKLNLSFNHLEPKPMWVKNPTIKGTLVKPCGFHWLTHTSLIWVITA